ncbi:putative bifunctional diguanylate cyclase/phosphodiesterase [Paenibacillus spongiae]|uniref:EAL domain-containing protein n=1 Tax=Paenibacillus spongiae TaxID=2909671 RepID=A0ABY5S868_9BACL|nr:EAL domain-containing protein [Paenibacillus spongiae]UVI28725.1 EAL domain-containing protein [Paenibacillus spongiae]
MSLNRADKKTLWTAIIIIISFMLLRILLDGRSVMMNNGLYVLVHSGIEYMSGAVCFAVLAIACLFYTESLTVQRLYTAVIFIVVGLFDMFHALTTDGMPFFRIVGDTSLSLLYGLTAQVIAAFGLFMIFSTDDRPIPASRRLPASIAAVGLGGLLAISYLSLSGWTAALPALSGNVWPIFRAAAETTVILTYSLTIGIMIYRHRSRRPQAQLMIMQAILLFVFANIQFILSVNPVDMDMLLGHVYKLAGYYYLMKGIYYLTIEEPFKKQQSMEARMRKLAEHDELTGLSNRRQLNRSLQAELERSEAAGSRFAVLLLDIDRFKSINEALGHSFGDVLLRTVSDRLRLAAARPDHVFRLGGDEFAVLMPDLDRNTAADKMAQRIMGMIDKPIMLGEADYHITISLGIAFYPQDGNSVDVLVKNADTAMYHAKKNRNEYQSYKPEMNHEAYDRLRLESDLRQGLEQEQFTLAYQPLVNLCTGSIVGVEALVRWQHPQRGLLPPGEFIPLTEDNGLILPLGEWVLRAACQQNKAWQDAGLPPMMMSVNLSMRQFRQHRLAERIESILEQTGMPPQYLELEITESMTSDSDIASGILSELKAIGVQISIDDFGTGYSSLGNLKKFPVDKLKIDRSFVTDMTKDGSDAAMITTITSLARHLNLKVTAEGVETDEQIRLLREGNCEEAQGFYFSKPIPANMFESWYRHRSQTA